MSDILERLQEVLRERRDADPEDSYTASLYAAGTDAIAAKITEEAAETVETAGGSPEHLVHEVADLWFHTLILLTSRGVGAQEVLAELDRRFGVSGHEEKARRD